MGRGALALPGKVDVLSHKKNFISEVSLNGLDAFGHRHWLGIVKPMLIVTRFYHNYTQEIRGKNCSHQWTSKGQNCTTKKSAPDLTIWKLTAVM